MDYFYNKKYIKKNGSLYAVVLRLFYGFILSIQNSHCLGVSYHLMQYCDYLTFIFWQNILGKRQIHQIWIFFMPCNLAALSLLVLCSCCLAPVASQFILVNFREIYLFELFNWYSFSRFVIFLMISNFTDFIFLCYGTSG